MDADAKKTALRMIPYGIYVLTAESKDGKVAASTVNWVTQTAFAPPLVVVGVKADSGAHAIIKESKVFALNMLGKDQNETGVYFLQVARARRQHHRRRSVPQRLARRADLGKCAGVCRMRVGRHHREGRSLDLCRRSEGCRRCRGTDRKAGRRDLGDARFGREGFLRRITARLCRARYKSLP